MKKKFTLMLFLLVFMLISAGCVKGEYHVKVNKDGSADMVTTLAMKKDIYAMASMEGDPFKESKDELKKEGYKTSEYKKDEFIGFTATKHFKEVKDININSGDKTKDTPFKITEEKGFFSTTYKVAGNFDLKGEKSASKEEEAAAQAMMSQMDLKFKLTMPAKFGKNNATKVDEKTKTLTWDLVVGSKNDIKLEAKVPNTTNIGIVIGGVAILLGGIAFAVVKRRKNSY